MFIIVHMIYRREKAEEDLSVGHFCLQPEIFSMYCLVRGRLNKFRVKQTAAFSHTAA